MKKLFLMFIGICAYAQIPNLPNHHAVLITGDTPSGAKQKIVQQLELLEKTGDTSMVNMGIWGLQEAIEKGMSKEEIMNSEGYDEFWNDTYLMWEVLFQKGWPDTGQLDHIHVLYGNGIDYPTSNKRYQASYHELPHITDHSAYYGDVVNIFDSLKYVMGPQDNLFCWTFDHGGRTGSSSSKLYVIDVSQSTSPQIVDSIYLPALGFLRMKVFGDYLYLLDYHKGLYIFDITKPYHPTFVSKIEKPMFTDFEVIGNFIYITNVYTDIEYEINIENPYNPYISDSFVLEDPYESWGWGGWGIACGNYHYVVKDLITKFHDFAPIDTIIKRAFKIEFPNHITDAYGEFKPVCAREWNDIELYQHDGVDSLIFIESGNYYDTISWTDIRILRASDLHLVNTYDLNLPYKLLVKDLDHIFVNTEEGYPTGKFYILKFLGNNLVEIGSISTKSLGNDYSVNDNLEYAYVADGDSGLTIIDIRTPENPKIISNLKLKHKAMGISHKDNFVYVSAYFPDSTLPVFLCTMDSFILDTEFASFIDSIQTNRKIFWMQQCFSGGFIDNLEDENSIIHTACKYNEPAYRADNINRSGTFYLENEYDSITGKTYHHGEYNFYTMNAVRQKEIWPYDNPPFIPSDMNRNGGTSIYEAYIWEKEHESRSEHPQYSDISNIGPETYLEWDDFAPPLIPSGGTYRYKRENDYNWWINLFWKKNSEVDFSGYNLYRYNNLIKKIYKDTSYLDFAMDLRGKPVMYKVSSFDLWGYESGKANIPLIYPIGISTYLDATGGNNGRRITFYNGKIYAFYSSENKVYCITSSDTGKTWSLPEYIGDGKYPVCDRITNGIIALWVNGASIIYRLNRNGIWEDEDTLPPLYIFIIPEESVHGILPPSIKVSRDTVNIFAEFVIISLPGEVYRLEWNYGKFHIDNPDFAWEGVDRGPGYYPMPPKPKTLSPTITLKSNTPLLGYDKDGKIFYAQKQDTIWKRWEICAGYSPSIDYKYPYVYLSFVDASSKLRVISFVPPSDTILNFEEMDFKEDIYNAEEPFIIGNDYLLWCEYDTSEHLKVRYSTFNPDSFYWDEPLDLSHIEWGDALSPQGIMIKRWVGTKLEKRLIPIWAEGIEPDIGIKNAEILPIPYIFAMADLGKEIPSPFTIKREGFIDYSEGTGEPVKIVDYDPDTLIYRIEELNPDNEYTIRLGLYQKSNTRWKERIEIDQTPIGEKWVYPGEVLWIEKKIPNVDIQDGKIEIRVIKKSGEYAVLGALYLYEGDEAGATSYNNFISLKDGFYIRPVMNGIEMNIPYEEDVLLRIYDITGRCVSIPLDGRIRGEKRITLKELPIGIYFFNARIGNKEFKGKIVNVR